MQLLRMESSGLGRPPFTHWSQASRPSCILTCGKDPNSLNPSIPNAGDVKDRKGNLGFALRAPGVVSEAGKYFVAGVHYLHHFNAEMTHVLRKLLGLPHDGLPPTGNPACHRGPLGWQVPLDIWVPEIAGDHGNFPLLVPCFPEPE
jgi:hypothetical protein